MFYAGAMAIPAPAWRRPGQDSGFLELRRTTDESPELRGMEFIEVEARTILNHVKGERLPFKWTINPYRGCSHSCVYCFARGTHTFLDMNAGRDFETKIVVKVNAPEVLRVQLGARRWKGEHVAMGTNTDPYQAAEGKYRLMPPIIRALTDFRNPFSILSKGTMILRDLDLLVAARAVTDVHTAFSIGTVDEDVWRRTEPGTPSPRKRLDAVRAISQAGIPCGVLMAPILPGISDSPDQLKRTAAAILDAGAAYVYPLHLHLRPHVKEEFMGWLDREYPSLVGRYEDMFQGRAYATSSDRSALQRRVDGAFREIGRGRPAQSSRGLPSDRGTRAARPGGRPAEQLSMLEG
jgi:DNA repair photolyase